MYKIQIKYEDFRIHFECIKYKSNMMMFVSTYGRGYIYEATNTPITPFGVGEGVGGWVGDATGGWWLGGGGGDRPHIWLLGFLFKRPAPRSWQIRDVDVEVATRIAIGDAPVDSSQDPVIPLQENKQSAKPQQTPRDRNLRRPRGLLGVQRPTSVVVGPAKLAPAATSMPRVAPCASNQALAGAGAAAAARTGEAPASRLPTHRE